ncbi:class I SAM-dependent methyltransferase [Dongia deserti]|uniref:class I SAM-dependent methyltransferase n=1 Tax=Dongia deserti TaxID=2268030 RepID=UPI002AC3298C|nr:50S ribosomal protein L11 methyltransferase [Dongia deserti]
MIRSSPATDPAAFILAQTTIATPPLTPEIKLHLATEITPIWEATEVTLTEMNLPPPYWAFAWPGGQALTRFLMDHRDWVNGKTVLDFAAGSGLSAIGAAKAGAANVQAAEIDDFAMAAITLNARINNVAIDLVREDQIGVEPRWDVVLAGDVCYERPMAERVIAWFRAMAGRGVAILMGDPGRAYLPQSGLVELARYQVPTSLELEDRTQRETIVWRLMP